MRLINPELRIKWKHGKIEDIEVPFDLQLLTQAIGEMLVRNLPICFNDEFPFVEEVNLVCYRKDEIE